MKHTGPRGIGGAVRAGWSAARYEHLLYLDSDMPVDPAGLEKLLSCAAVFPVAIGVRDVRGPSAWRCSLSRAYNAVIRALFGLPGDDVHFGVKLVSKSALAQIPLTASTAFFNAQLLFWARERGVPVKELPLRHTLRIKGYSKGVQFLPALRLIREMLGFMASLRLLGHEACWVLEHFAEAPVRVRLHVLARLLTCPWRELVGALPESGLIVDAGCGFGILELLAKRSKPGLEFFAFDPDADKLRWAAKACAGLGDISFSLAGTGNIEALPDADAVCQVDSLYLLPPGERPAFFGKVRAALKEGGCYLLKECASGAGWKTALTRIQEYSARKLLRYTRGSAMEFKTPAAMTEELAAAGFDAGFTDLSAWRPHPHALYLCRKKN
jgi:SAM-dependent methyltransferase